MRLNCSKWSNWILTSSIGSRYPILKSDWLIGAPDKSGNQKKMGNCHRRRIDFQVLKNTILEFWAKFWNSPRIWPIWFFAITQDNFWTPLFSRLEFQKDWLMLKHRTFLVKMVKVHYNTNSQFKKFSHSSSNLQVSTSTF